MARGLQTCIVLSFALSLCVCRFDTEQKGEISTKELSTLHKQLGEPLTDEEAQNAVSELDQEGRGSVTFNKFLIWWYHQHSR